MYEVITVTCNCMNCGVENFVYNNIKLLFLFFSVSVGFGGPCPSDDTWIFDGANQEWTELPTRCSPYLDSAMAPIIGTKGKAVLHGGTYRFGPVNSVINVSPLIESFELQ